MIVGSTKEDLKSEKRVSLTPETTKNIIGLGLDILIEKDYAIHLGINDKEYENAGAKIKNSSEEVYSSSDLLIKVNCPSDSEIKNLKEKTILIGMFNPSRNKDYIFAHGAKYTLPDKKILIGCYHPSPRNVNTKRIDVNKMVKLFKSAKKIMTRV